MEAVKGEMRGTVLDVGGKRENKRGSFQPPHELAEGWWYINLDLSTKPDVFADVAAIPVKSGSVDVVVCTEVLEHLQNPAACTAEIHRVLKVGGLGFFSVPFMYPVHADPYDYQRFTADGLRNLLSQFQTIEITPMGGYLGTVAMLMDIGLPGISGTQLSRKILRRGLAWFAKNLYSADINGAGKQPVIWSKFTSGYFVRIVK